jgi:hypothetical protein
MYKKLFFFQFLIYFYLFFAFYAVSFAGIASPYDEIRDEFKTIPASIIKLENQEIIIDKGGDQGIKKGDYFQVFKRGDVSVDPDTKEIIGYLKNKQAIVQVINTLKYTSHCEVVSGEGPFYVGQQLIRFSGIDSVFMGSDMVAKDVKALLIELNWVPAGFNSLLKFVYEGKKLEVFDHNSKKIREFDIQSSTRNKDAKQDKPEKNQIVTAERLHKDINQTIFAKIPMDIIQFEVDKSAEKMFFLTNQGFFVTPYRKKGDSQLLYVFSGIYKPVSFSISKDSRYIALNLIIPAIGYKGILLENGEGVKLLRKDINMYLSFEGDALYGQGLEKDRMPARKVFTLDIKGQELLYLSEEIYPEYFILKNSCFRDIGADGNTEHIFFHENRVYIKDNADKVSVFEIPSAKISDSGFYCLKGAPDNKAVIAVNSELVTISMEEGVYKLRSLNLLKDKENEALIGINKINDEIIIGVKSLSEGSAMTTLRSFLLKEIF